jgi:hypothetical protein
MHRIVRRTPEGRDVATPRTEGSITDSVPLPSHSQFRSRRRSVPELCGRRVPRIPEPQQGGTAQVVRHWAVVRSAFAPALRAVEQRRFQGGELLVGCGERVA